MSASPFLLADDVSVALGGRTVVRDASFTLPKRCFAALVGPNGAGKTTLLRALAGLVPARGTISIAGADVARLSLRERARRFAYLPQGQVVHWPLPAHDVVALGRFPHGATDPSRLSSADETAVARAMRATGTELFADRPVTELSGGERARVALARVLAVEAPVILADEPIASLDPRYALDVMQLLRAAADAGALVVVVTHDLGLAARFANRVLVLDAGRVAAFAPPEDALSERILRQVFRIRAFRASAEGAPVLVPWGAS